MIKRYKNFSIFKRKEIKSEKSPQYDVLLSEKKEDGSFDSSNAGGVWLKESSVGNKYFSAKLSDTRTFNEKVYSGYSIVRDVDLDNMIETYNKIVHPESKDYPDDINPEDIPF